MSHLARSGVGKLWPVGWIWITKKSNPAPGIIHSLFCSAPLHCKAWRSKTFEHPCYRGACSEGVWGRERHFWPPAAAIQEQHQLPSLLQPPPRLWPRNPTSHALPRKLTDCHLEGVGKGREIDRLPSGRGGTSRAPWPEAWPGGPATKKSRPPLPALLCFRTHQGFLAYSVFVALFPPSLLTANSVLLHWDLLILQFLWKSQKSQIQ